jgi:DNA-binding response OmpR family regulator
MRILSIDDSKAIHAYIIACLEGPEYVLEHAYDGEEALQKLQNTKDPFDLILLDWEMPGMTGPEVLRKIKELPLSASVIMVTTKNAVEDITQVLQLGAAEYIMKPFTKDILIEKIQSVVG